MKYLFFALFAILSCSNDNSLKSFDKKGVLYSETIDSTHWISYTYYKNKSIHKIAYLVNHVTNGKIDFIHEDSSIVFAMNGNKLLFTKQYDNVDTLSAVKVYLADGKQKDTFVNNFYAEDLEKILVGNDTVQLQYEFEVDQKKE